MANVNAPFGFRQYAGIGYSPTFEQVSFGPGGISGAIAYSNSTAIFFGDPVVRAGTGSNLLQQAVGSATTGTVTLVGIFVGCKYMSTAQKRTVWSNYWPGSDVASANAGATEAYVITDPNAKFVAQSDSTGLAAADIGSNIDFAIGTGTTSNGLSAATLTHGGATSSAYPFRFVDLVWAPPGANGVSISGSAAAYNWGIVQMNNCEARNLTAYNT